MDWFVEIQERDGSTLISYLSQTVYQNDQCDLDVTKENEKFTWPSHGASWSTLIYVNLNFLLVKWNMYIFLYLHYGLSVFWDATSPPPKSLQDFEKS